MMLMRWIDFVFLCMIDSNPSCNTLDPWFPKGQSSESSTQNSVGRATVWVRSYQDHNMHAIGHCCAVVSISHAKISSHFSFSHFFFHLLPSLYSIFLFFTLFNFHTTQSMDNNPSTSTQQPRPCEKASSMKKRFLKRAKEHRSRLYILKRCIIMLLCWQKYEQYWYSKPLFSRWIPLTTSTPLFFFFIFYLQVL